jgi:hypothetical protein
MPQKFEVGQHVRFTSSSIGHPGSAGVYNILKVLPSERQGQQYRIKSSAESCERIANETQLKKVN